MPSLPLALYTEKSNKGDVVRAQLASCASASGRGHGLMLARDYKGMAGQPCPPCIVDATKLKYLAVTVMTAESRVLAKSVRFLEHVHVSPGCCAGIASTVPVSWSA